MIMKKIKIPPERRQSNIEIADTTLENPSKFMTEIVSKLNLTIFSNDQGEDNEGSNKKG